jgi:Fe-S cluster biogenesis protein NfuA
MKVFNKGTNMEEKIRAKLEEVRGYLQADGGDMDVVSIEGKNVLLKLKGACGGCPHATMTIKQGIERMLREQVDESITVEQVK